MTRLRRVPPVVLPVTAFVVGAVLMLAGAYLLAGLAATLLLAGLALVVAGLVVDVG